MTRNETSRIAIDAIPELPTIVGMAGAMRRAEVGGSGCNDTGVLIITMMTL